MRSAPMRSPWNLAPFALAIAISASALAEDATPPSAPPAVWEISKESVTNYLPNQKVTLSANGKVLHTFTGADLRTFRDVYERISVTTGFTGAHLLIKDDPTLNAYAAHTKNGTPIVVFHSAMLELIHDNPDEIAAIMGHEFGHQVLHHKGYAGTTEAINIATQLLDAVIAKGGANQQVKTAATKVGGMAVTGVFRSFDRDQEREADEFGVKNMIRAGYNAEGAARLWGLPQLQRGGWLSTHPSSSERLDSVRAFAVTYASLAPSSPPASTIPEPPAQVAAKTFKEEWAKLTAELAALCKKDDYQAFWKKSPCSSNSFSFDNLGDDSKVTADEKGIIQKVRNDLADINRRMAQALRKYGGAKDDAMATVLEKSDQQSEEAMMNLYFGKSSWGDYNKRRKELTKENADKMKEAQALQSSPPTATSK